MFRNSFAKKLVRYTREFFAHHPEVKLIAVTGSAGKTSAKMAVATVLSRQYAVGMTEAEPNSQLQVLLQIMGVRYPDTPEAQWGWRQRRQLLKAVKRRARAERPEVQVIVQEFNASDLGYMEWFRSVVLPDIAVITSVTTGRMLVDHAVEAVAREMLTMANHARFALINRDDIDGRFAAFLTNPQLSTYGTTSVAEYYFQQQSFSPEDGYQGRVYGPDCPDGIAAALSLLGEHNLRPAVAAVAVGLRLGVSPQHIAEGLSLLRPLPGRMQLLRGADDTWLIDDSYSSSPLTASSALQTLYEIETPQRIAVLGTMNGLRESAPQGHAALGAECSPELLDWVVTVGDMANQHLAPAARQKGCQVKACRDAIEAGAFVREKLRPRGVALFKGSSGGVWLEEAVKNNLRSLADESRLVRQSTAWLAHKAAFFSRFQDSATIKQKSK